MGKYNILEVPRAALDVNGSCFFKADLGERDKDTKATFDKLVDDGFRVTSLSTDGHKYVFLFELCK